MSVATELSLSTEMTEEKPNTIIRVDDLDLAAVLSTMPEIHNEEIKEEEEPKSHAVCDVEIMNNNDFQEKEEKKSVKMDVSIEIKDKDSSPVIFKNNSLDTDHKDSETIHERISEGIITNKETENDRLTNAAVKTIVQRSSCSQDNEMEIDLDLEVNSIPERRRRKKEENNVETFTWETVEPVADPASGVRRSGRKRRRKKMLYVDLLEENGDMNCHDMSDEEWNFAVEMKSVKGKDDELLSIEPTTKKFFARSKRKKEKEFNKKEKEPKKRGRKPKKDKKYSEAKGKDNGEKSSDGGSKKVKSEEKDKSSESGNKEGKSEENDEKYPEGGNKDKEVTDDNANKKVTEKKPRKEYGCSGCDSIFLSLGQFRNHRLTCKEVRSIGEEGNFRGAIGSGVQYVKDCPVCCKSFCKANGVKRHMAISHSNLVHINCSLCSKKVGNIHDTFVHFQNEHQNSFQGKKKTVGPTGTLACPVCGDLIVKYSHIKQHLVNQHGNLLNVICALCQRTVGTMLSYLQHFIRYHSHTSSGRDKSNDVVTTNTEPVLKCKKPISNPSLVYMENFSSSTSSHQEDSNLICLQCNESLANYKLLILHMLSHKINENATFVNQTLNVPSETNSHSDQNPNEIISISTATDSSQETETTSRPLDEFPIPLYRLPPEILSSVNSVSAVLGPDLLVAMNRSFNSMTDLSAKLNNELTWNESDTFSTREELARRLNKILQFSSAITDVGKCLLLVLEECQQIKRNPYVDDDAVVTQVDEEEEVSVLEDQENVEDNMDNETVNNEVHEDCGDDDDDSNKQNGALSNINSQVDTVETNPSKFEANTSVSKTNIASECHENSSKLNSDQVSAVVDETNLNAVDLPPASNSDEDCEILTEVNINNKKEMDKKKNILKGSKNDCKNIQDKKMESARRWSQRLKEKATASTVKKGKKKFICQVCGKQMGKRYGLNNHMLTHSNAKPFKCKICCAAFKSEERLKRHLLIHSKDSRYKCDFCEYSHRTLAIVHQHCIDKHPGSELFTCDQCKHQSITSHDLEVHKRIHAPKKCKHCDFIAKHNHDLKHHMRKNHSNIFCPHCPFSCLNNYSLKRHLKTHVKTESDKLYCCELCGATFNNNQRLIYHMVRHADKKPLSCSLCEYRCSSKQSLDSHILKHAGLKPYKCEVCQMSFRRSSYLNQHKLMHSDEKKFSCRFCGKGFKYRYNCREHEMIHTGEKKYKCKTCNFACRRKKILVQHIEEHKARGSDVGSDSENDGAAVDEDIANLTLKTEDLVPIL